MLCYTLYLSGFVQELRCGTSLHENIETEMHADPLCSFCSGDNHVGGRSAHAQLNKIAVGGRGGTNVDYVVVGKNGVR